jgi:hypothetical protein
MEVAAAMEKLGERARVWRGRTGTGLRGGEASGPAGPRLPMAMLAQLAADSAAPPPRLANGHARKRGEGGGRV